MVGFFYWWLRDVPSRILYIGEKIIIYLYGYFSIPQLFRTLFDYWKKDEIDTTNMALDDKIKVLMMNLVSRFVGAAVRSITIGVGFLFIIVTLLLTVLALAFFYLLPAICLYIIINSLARI